MLSRLEALRTLIDNGKVPEIVDMSNQGWDDIWTWGDIEQLGYGTTRRAVGWHCDSPLVSRTYSGPNSIVLKPHNIEMVAGSMYSD